MTKIRVQIVVDKSLPERAARINSKTWHAVKAKGGHNPFFPEGDRILVGTNPFQPSYLLMAVDNEMLDGLFVVSADVKRDVYPSTEYLEF